MNSCRVLFAVAEKDVVTMEVAEYLETVFGCEVRLVHSGRNLMDVIKSFAPEVLIIEVFLPKADTFKVCAELKDNPATSHTVIIAVSMIAPNKRIGSIRADKIVYPPLDSESFVDVAARALRRIVAKTSRHASLPRERLFIPDAF